MIGNSEAKQINEILNMCDSEFKIDQGTGIAIYKHLFIQENSKCNMSEEISFNKPSQFSSNSNKDGGDR